MTMRPTLKKSRVVSRRKLHDYTCLFNELDEIAPDET